VHSALRETQQWIVATWPICPQDAQELGITRQPYCVIVGAGHCGLSLGAALKQLNVPTLILDKRGRSSDIWRDRHETLSLHSPSWFGHMPYFAYPEGWPLHRRRTSLPIGSTPIGLAVIWRCSSRSSHRAPA
jgi:putative flavoprotein involved in K+ transport